MTGDERKAPDFEVGQRVHVACSRYHGPGIVGCVKLDGSEVYRPDGGVVHFADGEFVVDVTPWIGASDFSQGYLHTNTWRYPADSITAAPGSEGMTPNSKTGDERRAIHHSLRRTSPMGERFVGTCDLCGKKGLTTADMNEECLNPGGATQEQALLAALEEDDA